jgi:adenylate kinase
VTNGTDAQRGAAATPATASGTSIGSRLLLVLIGAVGAGKGTQATLLADRLGIPHVASGDLFRAALAAGTPLGEQARGYMQRGELVPDEVTIGMVMERLDADDAARGAVLDGFPRTVGQARALDDRLAVRGEEVRRAVYIEVPTEELIRRVSTRWICPQCGTPYREGEAAPRVSGVCDRDGTRLVQRDDDRPEVVRERLAKQVSPMLEVVEHYRRTGHLATVDGRGSIESVTGDILAVLDTAAAPAGAER